MQSVTVDNPPSEVTNIKRRKSDAQIKPKKDKSSTEKKAAGKKNENVFVNEAELDPVFHPATPKKAVKKDNTDDSLDNINQVVIDVLKLLDDPTENDKTKNADKIILEV